MKIFVCSSAAIEKTKATTSAPAAVAAAVGVKQESDQKGRKQKRPQREDWMIERTVIINGSCYNR